MNFIMLGLKMTEISGNTHTQTDTHFEDMNMFSTHSINISQQRLKLLDVSHNILERLPRTIYNLTKLHSFNVKGNYRLVMGKFSEERDEGEGMEEDDMMLADHEEKKKNEGKHKKYKGNRHLPSQEASDDDVSAFYYDGVN